MYEPEGNHSDEQPAGGSSLALVDTSSTQTDDYEVTAAGESSGIGHC